MPSPVEAFPCGSRSISRTFSSLAASAVARLIAVVVLPTPPFWLAIARMRTPGAGGGLSRISASGCGNDTVEITDPEDAGVGGGTAWNAFHLHVPLCRRVRQFRLNVGALEE